MRVRDAMLALGALVCAATTALAAPERITDLTTGKGGYVELLTGLQAAIHDAGVSYFPAADAQHGTELWRSDGTPSGTFRLTDLCPGECASEPLPVGVMDGRVLFLAFDGERGSDLWVSRGGLGDEERLTTGLCQVSVAPGGAGFVHWHGAVWFLAQCLGGQPVLWRTDGTRAGTLRVARFCTDLGVCGFGQSGGYASLLGTDAARSALLFELELGGGPVLLRSDATRAGTARLDAPFSRVVATADSGAAPLYFVSGSDLWRSDGTAGGTAKVRGLQGLVTLDYDGTVYFNAAAVIGGTLYAVLGGGEWLRSDGTAAGTTVLAQGVGYGRFGSRITKLGDRVVVVTSGVWSTRGTPATTTQVSALPDDAAAFAQVGSRLYFVVNTYANPQPVWTTDGTAAGTRRLDLGPGGEFDNAGITSFGDGVLVTRGGSELWRLGPRAGAKLHDFEPSNGPSGPCGQTVLGDRLLFFARSGERSRLFSSDGTGRGTERLGPVAESIVPGCPTCFYSYRTPVDHSFAVIGDHAIFDTGDSRVWETDGTDGGTVVLEDGIRASSIGVLGDRFLFAGSTPGFSCGNAGSFPGESEPWVTDGTAVGTREIADLNPATYSLSSQCDELPESSSPGPGVRLGRAVLFAATERTHGRELFASDGTPAGTRLVADIRPGQGEDGNGESVGLDSSPSDLVRLGRRVLFAADDGASGRELWISDGGSDTRRLVDLLPGAAGSAPHDLVVFAGAVYFVARRGAGEALWRTDGTAAGTVLVHDLLLAGRATTAAQLVVAGSRLFFVGFNETTGRELWVSGGDAASTHLVTDLRPGPRGSQPQRLAAVDSVVVFAADDGRTGLEPWRSDGTPEGTRPLGNLARGRDASNPGPFRRVGERLLFGADDGVHGRELWSVPIAEIRSADLVPGSPDPVARRQPPAAGDAPAVSNPPGGE